jgi:hypothetical protein
VYCSNDGHITNLYLNSNNLHSTIPESLGDLSHLTDLRLHNNSLNSTIPDSLGNLVLLLYLNLQMNNLKGTIPGSLGSLSRLTALALCRNKLTGAIPGSLTKLSNITAFSVYNNKLTGVVPNLPFVQYTSGCSMQHEPPTNLFACPLPPDSDKCFYGPPTCAGKSYVEHDAAYCAAISCPADSAACTGGYHFGNEGADACRALCDASNCACYDWRDAATTHLSPKQPGCRLTNASAMVNPSGCGYDAFVSRST